MLNHHMKMIMTSAAFLALFIFTSASDSGSSSVLLSDLFHRDVTTQRATVWTGRYFPTPPSPPSTTPAPLQSHGGVAMGADAKCDDGKTNLTVDWNYSPAVYTCFDPNHRMIPDFDVQPLLEQETVPKLYSAVHYCMNETISYLNPLPTFGPHRPAWPRYGEYKYLPVQRWLHTLEHGGVVMLYHPCAHPIEVERLRRIVGTCMYRYVISPNPHLQAKRPLALLTWGKRLTMSAVNVETVGDFIKSNALHGPEKISRDGQYDKELIKPASIVSDTEDTDLCPATSLESLDLFWYGKNSV